MQGQQPSTPRSGESGFTLIEALVAVVILIFGLMAVTNLFIIAGTSNTVANQSSAATAAAVRMMEELKAKNFSELSEGGTVTSATSCNNSTYERCDDVPGVGRISTKWSIAQVQGDSALYVIRVRSEGYGPLTGARSRADFVTFRVCSIGTANGCPDSTPATP